MSVFAEKCISEYLKNRNKEDIICLELLQLGGMRLVPFCNQNKQFQVILPSSTTYVPIKDRTSELKQSC